jgi:hypothetical protein
MRQGGVLHPLHVRDIVDVAIAVHYFRRNGYVQAKDGDGLW